jgi:hypothetical protein
MKDTLRILSEYQKKLNQFKKEDGLFEPISSLLTTHLYVEYFINNLVEKHCKLKKKISEDKGSYSFAIKLDLIFEIGLIPGWLYFNLKRLNKIRNKLSHNLNFELLKTNLTFNILNDQNEVETIDLLEGLDKRKTRSNRNNIIIIHLPILTVFLFEAHIRRNNL